MSRMSFAPIALAVIGLGTAAVAQTPPPGMAGMGGPMTLESMQARQDQMFDRMDANADGMITGNELTILTQPPMNQMGGARIRSMITRADADRNARISREEMRNAATSLFTSLDTDQDGLVSPAERAAMMPAGMVPAPARMSVPSTAPAESSGMPAGMDPPNGG